MAQFSSVLDRPSTSAEPPKVLPVGSYICVVGKDVRIDTNKKTGNEFSEYTLHVQSALEDVDEELLDEALTKASGEKTPLQNKTIRATFWHTEDSLYRLKDFCDHCGVPRKDEDGEVLSHRDRMQLLPNRIVGISLKHTPSEDGERIFAGIKKTFNPDPDFKVEAE